MSEIKLTKNFSKIILTKLEIENEIRNDKTILNSSSAESIIKIIIDDINKLLFKRVEIGKKLEYKFNIKLNLNKILPYLRIYITDEYWKDITNIVVDLFREKHWNINYQLVYDDVICQESDKTEKVITEILFYEE